MDLASITSISTSTVWDTTNIVEKMDLTHLYSVLSQFINQWYFFVPIAIALLLASRMFPKIIVSVVGFIAGVGLVYPLILNILSKNNMLVNDETGRVVVMVLIGLVVAVIVYALFKFFFFLVGLLAGFFVGFWLYTIISPTIVSRLFKSEAPEWVQFVFAGCLALIVGIIVLIYHEKALSLISVVFGALILGFYGIFYLIKFFPSTSGELGFFGNIDINENTKMINSIAFSNIGILVFLIILVFLCVIGFKISEPGREKRKS